MTIGTKIIAVFTSPKKAFEIIAEKPDWLAPMIAMVIIGILFAVTVVPKVVMPAQIEQVTEQMRDRGATDEQIEQTVKIMTGPITTIFGVVGALLGTPITLLVISGILFGVCSLFGGQAKFLQVFSAYTYAGLIASLGGIVKGILMWTQQSIHVGTSLALLLSEDLSKTFLYRLLGHFDLFTLWQLGALIIGLAVIYRWKATKAAGIVLSLWALWVLLASALGGLIHIGVS
jgi:tryptophan-rich sensory protein